MIVKREKNTSNIIKDTFINTHSCETDFLLMIIVSQAITKNHKQQIITYDVNLSYMGLLNCFMYTIDVLNYIMSRSKGANFSRK
jgi:hypothetical protein